MLHTPLTPFENSRLPLGNLGSYRGGTLRLIFDRLFLEPIRQRLGVHRGFGSSRMNSCLGPPWLQFIVLYRFVVVGVSAL